LNVRMTQLCHSESLSLKRNHTAPAP
jgi:hypothetical protein